MSTSQLSPYPSASLRELLHISVPLMLMALSTNFMLFSDRVILAYYNIEAMNAAAAASVGAAIFFFGGISITSIAEVFVGQFNGAKQYNRVAEPVWQMIWFSLSLNILYIPLALFSWPWLLPPPFMNEGKTYFQLILGFGMLGPLSAALGTFFVGRGEVKLVTINTIFINILNFGLNIILVFGISNFFVGLGAVGAAIATITSQAIGVIVLFIAFLAKKHRHTYKTNQPKLRPRMMMECLKIGLPVATSHMLEVAAWAMLLHILARFNPSYATVFNIVCSIYILFSFATEGMHKGITAIGSNLIGGRLTANLKKLMHSGMILVGIVGLLLLVPFFFYPGMVIQLFVEPGTIDTVFVFNYAQLTLKWLWAACIIESIVWIFAGLLTAAGDTRFTMFVNASCSWFLGVLPVYLIHTYGYGSPATFMQMSILYSSVNALLFYWRYRYQKWKKLTIG